jgi:predicted nucleic acid-binding protein
MPTLYLETTIIGHLAGRLHPDPLIAVRQKLTRNWWSKQAGHYTLYISQLVIDECSEGDATAAAERLATIQGIELLPATAEIGHLAKSLIAGKAIPASEPRDALHIAIAAVHDVNYLMTWNFRHIANAALRQKINQACRLAGFEPPIICSPEELGATNVD